MDEQRKEFPYEFEVLDSQEKQEITNNLEGYNEEFIRVGPKKCFLYKLYMSDAASIYHLPLRSDDTFVITFPKSGTTLTQELVWLICNNLDYEKALSMLLAERFPFLDCAKSTCLNLIVAQNQPVLTEEQRQVLNKSLKLMSSVEVGSLPSPRFIKSHLQFTLLPAQLLDKAKVVYVARDPRDVAVSFYHHYKLTQMMTSGVKFKNFWKCFVSDNVLYAPYFQHVLEAWEKRNHPNMLFMFYEEMIQDMPGAIRSVANFFGKTLTEEQVTKLAQHLDIDNFRKNKSVNLEDLQNSGVHTSNEAFIRKGKSGGWRDYFDEEMTAQAEKWIADNLRHTDFRFPHF